VIHRETTTQENRNCPDKKLRRARQLVGQLSVINAADYITPTDFLWRRPSGSKKNIRGPSGFSLSITHEQMRAAAGSSISKAVSQLLTTGAAQSYSAA
jgi:hypothetical protein